MKSEAKESRDPAKASSDREELSGGKYLFAQSCAHRMHWLIDNLTEMQLQRHIPLGPERQAR